MQRAFAVKPADTWDHTQAVDRVVLDADERHRRRVVLKGEGGTIFMLDLPRPVMLKDGDGLVLEDSGMVQVIGRPESLVAITAQFAGGTGAPRLAHRQSPYRYAGHGK